MLTSYRKSGSLNPNLQPEVELMYLLRVLRHYRHKNSPKMVSRALNDRAFIEKRAR